MRILKITLSAFAAILLLTLSLLFWIAATGSGTSFILGLVPSFADGVSLKYRGGTLLHGIQADDFSLSVPDTIDVSAKSLDLAWDISLSPLKVKVSRLHGDGLKIKLITPEGEAESPAPETCGADGLPACPPPSYAELPLEIEIQDLLINKAAYLSDIIDVTADTLSLKGSLGGHVINADLLAASGLDVHLKSGDGGEQASSGQAKAGAPQKAAAAKEARSPEEAADGGFEKLAVFIPFDIRVKEAAVDGGYRMEGLETGKSHIELSGRADAGTVDVYRLLAHTEKLGSITLRGSIGLTDYMSFDVSGYDADVSAFIPKDIPARADPILLSLTGTLQDLKADLRTSVNGGFVRLKASGNVIGENLPFSASLLGKKLSYSLPGLSPALSKITLDASGNLSRQSAVLRLDGFTAEGVPAVKELTADVTNDSGLIKVKGLKAELRDGSFVSLAGSSADLRKGIGAVLKAEFDLRDFTALVKDLKGNAAGTVDGTFAMKGEGFAADLKGLKVRGSLMDLPLSADAALSASFGKDLTFSVRKLLLQSGSSTVEASGTDRDLGVRLSLPAIEKLWPDAKGSISGKVSVKGGMREPVVNAAIDIPSLSTAGIEVSRGSVRAESLRPLQRSGKLSVSASEVLAGGQRIRPELVFSGTEKSHELTLSALSDLLTLRLAAAGGVKGDEWKGALSRLDLRSPEGSWSLRSPFPISYGLKSGELKGGELSLVSGPSGVKVSGIRVKDGSGSLEAEIRSYDFARLRAFLPQDLSLKGLFDLKSTVAFGKKEDIRADFRTGTLTVTKDRTKVSLGGIDGKVSLRGGALDAGLRVSGAGGGLITADVKAQSIRDLRSRLSGSLKLTDLRLSEYRPLLADTLRKLEGRIGADVRIGGTLGEPRLDGSVTLRDGKAETLENLIDVRDFTADIGFSGPEATIKSSLRSGPDGTLGVTGRISIAGGAPKGSVTVRTAHFPVGLLDFGTAHLTSDITAKMDSGTEVSGTAEITDTLLGMGSVPENGVGESDDIIVAGSEKAKLRMAGGEPPSNLSLRLDVRLGDDVRVDAMGFKSGLSGGVRILQKPGKPLGIFGKISIENGRYRSMWQNLLVETGEVRFSGTPDSGLINVQAIRDPTTIDDDVKAGIKVYGPIQKPKVSVFSEPELDESEALSYILRGHGTDGESDTGSLAMSMMISAGLSVVGGSVTGMLETFGVRDVELDTTGKNDNTKVSISGYVAPRLRVQYGIGIFDSASEVSVRYDLARDLYVRFVSGLSQAADLVYTLEFD